MTNEFRDTLSKKTNDDLLNMIIRDRESYTPQALKEAEAILRERGVDFVVPESGPESNQQTTTADKPFMPFVIGMCFVLLAFVKIPADLNYDSAWTVSIFINIVARAITLIWLIDLCRNHNLNKTLWLILGVIFGGWTLIAVNVVIWSSDPSVPSPVDVADTQQEEQAAISDDVSHGLSNCPACNFNLSENEKSCPDCGLAL